MKPIVGKARERLDEANSWKSKGEAGWSQKLDKQGRGWIEPIVGKARERLDGG
jgi:hypothetical protein